MKPNEIKSFLKEHENEITYYDVTGAYEQIKFALQSNKTPLKSIVKLFIDKPNPLSENVIYAELDWGFMVDTGIMIGKVGA